MPFVDDSGEYNDASFALDTHAATAGEPSLFDSAAGVITKGIPLTGLSIVNSFANTAIEASNWLTGGDTPLLSVQDEVGDGELNDYYQQHQQGIEAAGLVVGSLIPGTIAIKALKLAQLGRAGMVMARATNIFAGPKQKIIDGALQEINAGDGALYGSFNADKFKAIALGFGDQALQALSYEVATAATMKASPLLDKDSLGDVMDNMFYGALVGGGIGGVVEGIGTRALINKAIVNADINSKAQEVATYLGRGGYFAGDRVLSLLDSIDNIPARNTLLQTKKFEATQQTAILNSKKILAGLVDGEDKDVTNSIFNVLYKMKTEGGMNKDEMFNYLARLDRVSRITDPAPDTGTGTIFYVNRFADRANADWSKLVTDKPLDNGNVSLGYRLKNDASTVKVARFGDAAELPDGAKVPLYSTAKEAFEAGNDVFIGKDLRVFINDNAPNIERVARPGESRPLSAKEEAAYRNGRKLEDGTTANQLPKGSEPLYGAPVILNTITGGISSDATPVVGDYGAVKLFDKGLQYGDKTSMQNLSSVVTKDTPTIDANARYVWWAERGLQRGDTISADDIAGLEQMYREGTKYQGGWGKFLESLSKKGVNISDMEMPQTSDDLLLHIRQQKDQLIADLLNKDSKLSSEDVSLRANVPESYLANSLKAEEPKDYMVNPAQHKVVNHARLEYNIGNVYQQDGNILRGMLDVQYRVALIKDTLKSATADFFGEPYEQFLSDMKASDANILSVGPKAFSFSNAAYNTLGQQMERIGKTLTQWVKGRMDGITQKLSSATNAIREDQAAAAELGMFRAVRQRTGENFVFLNDSMKAQYFPRLQEGQEVAVLKKSVDKKGNWDYKNIPENFTYLPPQSLDIRESDAYTPDTLRTYYILSPKVADFERANMEVNNARLMARNKWYAAQGLSRQFDLNTLYTPPIDTTKYAHIALVKGKPGTGLMDDGVAVITAENAKDLEQKIAAIDSDRFSVFTKSDLKSYHEVLGDYEYDRNFAQSQVNSMLLRKGVLNNIFPDTRAETIIKDYVDWHSKQELRLSRDYVELGNAQLFAELRAMGERFTSSETSKTGFVAGLVGRTAPNPYGDYVKTALGISEKENYRMWADANEKLEAFFDTGFRAARNAFGAARKGVISYEEASKIATDYGIGNPYQSATDAVRAYYDVANKLPPARILSRVVSTANATLAASVIRLDFFQSLINAVSTPVLLLSEANSVLANPEIRSMMTTELPDGSQRQIPAVSKLLYNGIHNYFNEQVRNKWMPTYKQLQIVRDKSSEYFQMLDQLALPYGSWTESGVIQKIKNATDLGAKLTGSELSEEFGRFIAADVARQIFEGVGYSGKKLTDNISTFVNRVHGNYIASQRPIAFQGPIGQALGLFQTYQFNLLQQLFRYVENGEGKTLAILAGMQTTLFGLQGLPGFAAINNHIIGNAANNPSHKDLYSTVPNFFDKKIGDYLLYGVLSNWLNTGLYGRGDINPRQITVIPVNPLDYPAISGGIRFIGNLIDTAGKIANGGSVASSLLLGLEHNGLSRPLSGLAQLAQGFVTTADGKLVAATGTANPLGDNTQGWNDFFNVANLSRLLGARPLDEAIAMDQMYRKTLYTAKDNARMTTLGSAVKTTLYDNQEPTQEELTNFATNYAKAGGNINNFAAHMMKWTTDANASIANKVFRQMADPQAQQMMQIMGGVPLPDFRNSQEIEATAGAPAPGQ